MAFVRVPGNPEPEGAEEHWLEGRGGVRVRIMLAPATTDPQRGSVILCPGRTEFIEKYFETVHDLQKRGFAVLVMDWRGQGLSGREPANPLKGHFDSFDDPVNDLNAAVRFFAPRLPRPHLGLAHSMGGAILLRALQTRRIDLDGAVFSAPMWGVAALGDLVKGFVRFMSALGLGHLFAPSVEQKWRKENWKRSPVTQDRERHARNQGLVIEEPRLQLAGPTIGWLAAAAAAIEGFMQPASLAHIRMPIVVVLAGKEMLVDNKQIAAVAELLPDAQVRTIEGAKHELLMELDEYRDQFMAAFDDLAYRTAPVAAA